MTESSVFARVSAGVVPTSGKSKPVSCTGDSIRYIVALLQGVDSTMLEDEVDEAEWRRNGVQGARVHFTRFHGRSYTDSYRDQNHDR